jgi:hypothetical protein
MVAAAVVFALGMTGFLLFMAGSSKLKEDDLRARLRAPVRIPALDWRAILAAIVLIGAYVFAFWWAATVTSVF